MPPGTSSFCVPIAVRALKGESLVRVHINTLRNARPLGSAHTHDSARTQSADLPRGRPLVRPDPLLLLGEAENPHVGALTRGTPLPPKSGVNPGTNTTPRRGTRRVSRPNEALLERPLQGTRKDLNRRWSHSPGRNSRTLGRWPSATAWLRKHLRARKPPLGRAPRSPTSTHPPGPLRLWTLRRPLVRHRTPPRRRRCSSPQTFGSAGKRLLRLAGKNA
jgi:hypothetical protein